MTLTVNQQQADPKAIAVVRAVQDAVQNNAVIVLFGSRACGDYRDNSDLDLMMLVPEWQDDTMALYATARQTANKAVRKEYAREMNVDLVEFDHKRFRDRRRAINNVAYDITRDGISMSELPLEAAGSNEDYDGLPDNWPDTRERIRDALSSFRHLRYDLNDGGEKYLGRNAQETLEHCYKALIAALGVAYQRTHDLRELEAQLAQLQDRHGVNIPASPEWLQFCYGGIRYEHTPQIPESPQVFFERVQQVKDAIIARVYELTGTTESDLYPDE